MYYFLYIKVEKGSLLAIVVYLPINYIILNLNNLIIYSIFLLKTYILLYIFSLDKL